MKKLLFVPLLLSLLFSCSDENANSTNFKAPSEERSDEERIDALINHINPVLGNITSKRGDISLISYEIVKNKETNEITILNFQQESYFPTEGKEAYSRIAGDSYTVECTTNGKTTTTKCDGKLSCGKAIANCLDNGGCATICKNDVAAKPKTYGDIRSADIALLQELGLSKKDLKTINSLPSITLTNTSIINSVKIYGYLLE